MEDPEFSNPTGSPGPEQNLQSWRLQIDSLDEQISTLLAARLQAARALTKIKAQLQMPTHDQGRETQILQKLVHSSGDDHEIAACLQSIYQSIFSQSRNLQKRHSALVKEPSKSNTDYFPTVMIIGLGLIGGSLARQIKSCLPQTTVVGIDNAEVLSQALANQAIDHGHLDFLPHLSAASLLILAASPEQNLHILQELAPHLGPGQLVVDVGSCKLPICTLAEQLELGGADFIGGHPLFGSEKSGFAGCLELDLPNKVFCLTPGTKSSQVSVKRLSRWLVKLKLNVEITSADTHDYNLSKLSHLLQILCIALGAETAGELNNQELQQFLKLAGPSFQQISRLMSSPYQLWQEISGQNQELLSTAISAYIGRLSALQAAITAGDNKVMRANFEQAANVAAVINALRSPSVE